MPLEMNMYNPQCGISYLYIGEINIVLFKEANEFHEVLFCWVIVTTVWPNSLQITQEKCGKNDKQSFLYLHIFLNQYCMF